MHKTLKFTGLVAVAALAALLYTLRHNDHAEALAAPAASGTGATAAVIAPQAALPAAAITTTTAAPAALATAPTGALPAIVDNGSHDIPAFASTEQREATREQRQAALPAVLRAADVTLAQVRADIGKLKARGAPAAEIEAAEARLQRLTVVREQVLARNADIAGAH